MMRKLWMIFFALTGFCMSLQADEGDFASRPQVLQTNVQPSTIKVLLATGLDRAIVETKGAYRIVDPFGGELLSKGSSGRNYPIVPIQVGLKWGEEFPGIYQIEIVPDDAASTTLVNGIQYRGSIQIYQIDGKLNIVNEIDTDDFCKSMLSAYLNKNLSEEALAAVAITARTSAYHYLLANRNAYWHLSADEVGYEGYALTSPNQDVDQAVQKTRELVMTYEEQEGAFPAIWTENCAGKTVPYHLIFRTEGYDPTQSVTSPYAALSRKTSAWNFSINKTELAQLIEMEKVTSLNIYADSSTGKVYAARFYNGDVSKDLDFFELQQVLGKERLLSNDFTVDVARDDVNFSGCGEGHGVGLCLYSAQVMAEKGQDASQILSAFFPGAKIKKLAVERPKRKKTLARSYAQRRRSQ